MCPSTSPYPYPPTPTPTPTRSPHGCVTAQAQCILALTATASKSTERAICSLLGIGDADGPCGVIRVHCLRPNLHLSASRDTNRKQALLDLLSREPFHSARFAFPTARATYANAAVPLGELRSGNGCFRISDVLPPLASDRFRR